MKLFKIISFSCLLGLMPYILVLVVALIRGGHDISISSQDLTPFTHTLLVFSFLELPYYIAAIGSLLLARAFRYPKYLLALIVGQTAVYIFIPALDAFGSIGIGWSMNLIINDFINIIRISFMKFLARTIVFAVITFIGVLIASRIRVRKHSKML